MIYIRRRQDLIDLAFEHAPSKACQAAMSDPLGKISFLGSFTAIEGFPGWVIEVRSVYEKTWLIAICVNEVARTLPVRYIERVPWESWAGNWTGVQSLLNGDDPKHYAVERMKARASPQTIDC